jgi:hypothetical protein
MEFPAGAVWARDLVRVAERITDSESVQNSERTDDALNVGGQYGESTRSTVLRIADLLRRNLRDDGRFCVRDIGSGSCIVLFVLAAACERAIVQGVEVSLDRFRGGVLALARVREHFLRAHANGDPEAIFALRACARIRIHRADATLDDADGVLPPDAAYSFDVSWCDDLFSGVARQLLNMPTLALWTSARASDAVVRRVDLAERMPLLTTTRGTLRASSRSFRLYTRCLHGDAPTNHAVVRASERVDELTDEQIVEHAQLAVERARPPADSCARAKRSRS